MPFGGQLLRFREQVIRDVDGRTHDPMMTRFASMAKQVMSSGLDSRST
jgi:hypothetical protein